MKHTLRRSGPRLRRWLLATTTVTLAVSGGTVGSHLAATHRAPAPAAHSAVAAPAPTAEPTPTAAARPTPATGRPAPTPAATSATRAPVPPP
ncbi:hypothetical protein, partial [Modestobacter altitudinis]|uniref:hypothetical protein n=1 Tax=Modestobacter altitudinis TaxID=2213158 RepID=UPI001C55462B